MKRECEKGVRMKRKCEKGGYEVKRGCQKRGQRGSVRREGV